MALRDPREYLKVGVIYGPGDGTSYRGFAPLPPVLLWQRDGWIEGSEAQPLDENVYVLLGGKYVQALMSRHYLDG